MICAAVTDWSQSQYAFREIVTILGQQRLSCSTIQNAALHSDICDQTSGALTWINKQLCVGASLLPPAERC